MSLIGDIGKAVFGGNMMGVSTALGVGGDLLAYHGAENSIDAQMQQVARNEALQREFAQHGVRWRVEDAKAAGVHPLFALGGSGAAFAPSALVGGNPNEHLGRGLTEMGQNISRAVAAQETEVQRAQRHVSLQLANAAYAKDMAQADYYSSLAARARQEGRGSTAMPPADPNLFADPAAAAAVVGGAGANRIKLNPSEVTSYAGSDDSLAAGRDVLWKKFKVGGRDWILPNASNAGEALESVSESWPLMYFVIRENMHRNPNFVRENAHLIPYGREGYEAADLISAAADRARKERRWREMSGVGDPGNSEWRGRARFRSFK